MMKVIEIKIDKLITNPININKVDLIKSKEKLIAEINAKFIDIVLATK
jgi:hypothetical protein